MGFGTALRPPPPASLLPGDSHPCLASRPAEKRRRMEQEEQGEEADEGRAGPSQPAAQQRQPEGPALAPQVQVVDGRIVINQQSLTGAH